MVRFKCLHDKTEVSVADAANALSAPKLVRGDEYMNKLVASNAAVTAGRQEVMNIHHACQSPRPATPPDASRRWRKRQR